MTETIPGTWSIDHENYHADRGSVSHSGLEMFRRSARLYHGRYVTKTIPWDEPSASMLIGSALHCRLLEPDEFNLRYVQAPACDRRTKVGKFDWAEFQKTVGRRKVLDAATWQQVQDMAAAVLAHAMAADLLAAAGKVEHSIRWEHGMTGMGLKARFDKLLDAGILLDVKTAADPSPEEWARSAHRWGYHRQAALYQDGREAVYDLQGEFWFATVGSQPPYDVALYELDEAAVNLGRKQNEQTVSRLYEAFQTERWDNEWGTGVNRLSLPRWAFTQGVTP